MTVYGFLSLERFSKMGQIISPRDGPAFCQWQIIKKEKKNSRIIVPDSYFICLRTDEASLEALLKSSPSADPLSLNWI